VTIARSTPPAFSERRKLRLAYFVSHPIQYQAPLLRRIAKEPDIDLKVFFSSDISMRGHVDQGFGVKVKWDIPLLDGYQYEFLPVVGNTGGGDTLGFAKPVNLGIKRRVREGHFDAVWVHGYHSLTSLIAIRAASSLRVPVLLRTDSTLHDRQRSGWKLQFKSLFFKILKSRLSCILSVGEDNTAYWKHYLSDKFPIFECYYAVDNDYFQRACRAASRTREQFRTSLGLEAGRPVILFAAKLMPRKRCGDLLDAFLKLSKSGSIQPAPYLLVAGSGEELSELEKRAEAAPAGSVRFLGFRNQSELPALYDLCDVFVLPSIDEPWGLAVNEVMNAGKAVIVSDQVGCHKNLVRPGFNGYVTRARDVQDLANSLAMVLPSQEKVHSMGQESLRIINEYSFEQNIRVLRTALEAMVQGFQA
jgi:glycosyltransferase involved in cell wall biosynthesis